MLQLIDKYGHLLLDGALTTVFLFAIVSVSGLLLGLILGHVQHFSDRYTGAILQATGILVVSCPIIVLLHWAYFPLQIDWQYKLGPFGTSAFVLSAVNTLMIADTVANGLGSLPKHLLARRRMFQIPLGMFFLRIWFPLLFIGTLHSVLLIQLNMLHMTLFAALIGAEELFRAALRINSMEISGTRVFSMMAIVFITVSAPVHFAAGFARRFAERIRSSSGP
ncbi:MAG: hypothetical protein ACFHX7_22020 [Pseudomonadota bacterium]